MVQGSGVSVGPGVRAGGLEDGAQWAPRLLVLYNIISNASFTYSIVWTFAMTCCKERPGRTNTKVFLVLCEVQKILKYRYKGSQHLKKVEFYEKLSQTGGGGSVRFHTLIQKFRSSKWHVLGQNRMPYVSDNSVIG